MIIDIAVSYQRRQNYVWNYKANREVTQITQTFFFILEFLKIANIICELWFFCAASLKFLA